MDGRSFRSLYPDFNVLDKWASTDWDEQTRAVIRHRLEQVPQIRFFSEHELAVLGAVVERLLPQPDRAAGDKVPIVPWIDDKLFRDQRNGYRYEGMPPQREAWRLGLAGIDESAQVLSAGRCFLALDEPSQDRVLTRIAAGDAPGSTWTQLSAARFFKSELLATVVKIYYAHPRAWNETGYNGPSSPRGHVRIWDGGLDPWEAHPARHPEGVRHEHE